jgi:hypothetical protein
MLFEVNTQINSKTTSETRPRATIPGHPLPPIDPSPSLSLSLCDNPLDSSGPRLPSVSPQVLPHAVRLSSDANSTARQNATFCLGILGQFGGPAAIDVMQTLLTALQPRLADEEASVCDNGVASLARLVLAFGATLPLASILPAIVTRLPLRADSGENRTCCRALMRIAQDDAARAHLAPHVPQMLAAFSEMLMSEGERLATEELKGELRAFLIWIVGVAPELRASLPAALQQAL